MAIQAIHKESQLSINLLCDVAEIPRSSYYKWLKRKTRPNEDENKELIQAIVELYESVKGIYGYRRITMKLNKRTGRNINHKRIYRLMRLAGIQSVIRKKRKKYTKSTPQHIAENLLNRVFTAEYSNQKWVTDVTEFKYGDGQKAYLSAILDLYDKSIVAYVIGNRNDNALVFRTLDSALKVAPSSTPMLHSDRGFQYTSSKFKRKLDKKHLTQSMSRVGKCIDNGPMEGFWGTLKCEMYYLEKFETYETLKEAIMEYINFYNHERLQAKLNGFSPMEFRTKAS